MLLSDTVLTVLMWLALGVTYWVVGRVIATAASEYFGFGGARLELDPAESLAATVWWPFVLAAAVSIMVLILTAHLCSPKPWGGPTRGGRDGDLG